MTPEPDRLGLGLVRQPKAVVFGPGQRRQLAHVARGFARHVLIVTDARMAASAEFAGMISDLAVAAVEVSVFDQALPDLPLSTVINVLTQFGDPDRRIDAVVGIGGGSCLDLAKVVGVMLAQGGDPRSYFGEFRVPGPGLPVIAVPTTGGTGAEVTCIAVVFDDAAGMKVGIADPALMPAAAIIDPELTLTCPPGLTAAVAADTLSHLVEAFTARYKNPTPQDIATRLYVGKNRITDIFCAEGLRLVDHAIARVVADPSDLGARGDMMFAAYCAGTAICSTGTAAAHALQAPMTAVGHVPHGFGVGALLPYVMRFNLPVRVEALAEMARHLGVAVAATPAPEAARAAITRVEELLAAAGAPLDLASIGLRPEHVPELAAAAMKSTRLVVNNPRPLTEAGCAGIYARGIAGDRSWWEAP